MGRYPGDKGGRPRKDGTPALPAPIPGPGQRLCHETHELVSYAEPKYSSEQKAQAIAAYSVTNSATQARKVLEGLWGPGAEIPGVVSIRGWATDGVKADETALDSITRWYEARRKVLAFEVFERAQEALVKRPLDKEKLFNVTGVYKIAGDTVAQAFQRPQGGAVMDMRGATFIRSGDKPIPQWDHEVEAKVIDGNSDG